MSNFSIYLHIPFCLHKCPYCDFNTYALATFPEQDYVNALRAELDFRAADSTWKGRTVQTIYFGGGTPSLFSPESISKIISTIRSLFPILPDAEISLEANPGTLSFDKLNGYRSAGVNRLSIGAQSFNPDTLKLLGRMHTLDHIDASVETARSVGITNINIDLIYGAPSQAHSGIKSDIAQIARLDPTHVSPYGLTIEKGTPYYSSYKKGILKLPKEDSVIEMMEFLNEELPILGLDRYEISNFAKPGYEAKHNMAYWNGDDYLGVGAGAHSFASESSPNDLHQYGRRWANYALPQRYMSETTAHGTAESWAEVLDLKGAMFEYFFMGLRKIAGVSISRFESKFGVAVRESYPGLLDVLTSEDLVTVDGDTLALSARGLMLADSVIEHFASPEIIQKAGVELLTAGNE